MSESNRTMVGVWAYLVATVLAEVGLFSTQSASSPLGVGSLDAVILTIVVSQAIMLALYYMRLRYETRYLGFLLVGAAAIGCMALFLFLFGIMGLTPPQLTQ